MLKHLLPILLVWFWISDEGTYCYSQEKHWIPNKYAEKATQVEIGAWRDYRKLSFAHGTSLPAD